MLFRSLVGEVVSAQPELLGDGFSTALRYRFIDEADRDRIVGYISGEQLAQLSRHGHGERAAANPPGAGKAARRMGVAICLLILAALMGSLASSIVAKRERGEKHEIERIFEEGIATILRQRH